MVPLSTSVRFAVIDNSRMRDAETGIPRNEVISSLRYAGCVLA
jgi:hypothetical protein